MNLIFDNIIYSLQKSGGGSVYWTELLKRFEKYSENKVLYYEQSGEINNIFRKSLKLTKVKTETFLNLPIRRYLNFTKPITEKSIFHSSYFRISASKNAVNITTIHDFTTEKFRTGIARRVNLLQKKHAVMNSAGIICISENTKKDLLHFIPKVDPGKIIVIYNGVSDDFFKISEEFNISEQDAKFLSLENEKYLLYIGHRTDYKNFPLALKAAAIVKDKYKLVIVGEPLTADETVMTNQYLGSNYLQISKLDNEKLNLLYNKAFALLYPSSYEGFGIPLVEAMKTHCPVIASKNSSIPEVVGDGGIVLENCDADSIAEKIVALEDIEFRNKLVAAGVLQSKKFNWDQTYMQYLEFYKKVFNE